ncbi:MAG: GxxExxY protein [Ignavibacteriales bacterium]|nr:MAG: GxxExxY protein [Ignavibacteriales bacterium]
MTDNLIYKEESYLIIGKCFEVHRSLGCGFLEAVYKDALQHEFYTAGIEFKREREYKIYYKDQLLAHSYFADFVVMDKIILEVKAISALTDQHIAQTLNYLAASGNKLGILVNFGEASLRYKRIVL